MKKFLLSLSMAVALTAAAQEVTSVTLNGTNHQVNTLIDRQLGSGVQYLRLRLPSYPLNVNMLIMDMTNPYNRIETTQASETLYKTEGLVNAAKRQTREGHKALAGANANFWCVSGQPPYSDLMIGLTFNGNLHNGKIISETNCRADQWNGGPKHTGIFGVTPDKTAVSGNNFTWVSYISSDKFSPVEVAQANKIVREDEICMYNSYYGVDKKFMPADQYLEPTDNKVHFSLHEGTSTEVMLTIDEGQEWCTTDVMTFTVGEVRKNAGRGTLGKYDLALVGRGNKCNVLDKLEVDDKVNLMYTWITPEGQSIKLENLVGGNAQVMVNGELTKYNDSENYNSMVYSRTGYGTSADGKTAYIIVIDKSNSPTYGSSVGCTTTVMCQIAQAFGCVNLTNFDAGGSAQMLVGNKIINTTTEAQPRAVANGMLLYSIAPEDNEPASLVFYERSLKMPPYSTSTPRVIAYNKYGDIISDDFQEFTLSCPEENGTCTGNEIYVSGIPGSFPLTASYGNISVTKDVEVVDSEIIVRIPNLLLDGHREYTMEVTTKIDQNDFIYDPSKIIWSVADPAIATVDENGVVKGHSEGTTEISATIGDFVTKSKVTVEIADDKQMHLTNWENYTSKGSSGCAVKNFENGVISFSYASPRDPYVQVSNETEDFYSIPETLVVDFTATATLSDLSLDVRTPAIKSTNILKFTPAGSNTFEAGKRYEMSIPVADLFDADDIINYPVSFAFVRFSPVKTSDNKGDHTVTIHDIRAEYSHYTSVSDIAMPSTAVISIASSANAGQALNVTANDNIRSVEIYSVSGRRMASVKAASHSASIVAPAQRGVYIVRVTTAAATASRKIIVK